VDVQVEKPEATLARITLTVPADEFQGEYKRGLQHERGRVRMKGFRPGKAPLAFVEKQVGAELREGLKQHFVSQAYRQAQEEHGIKPFANPRVPKEAAEEGEDGGFTLTFEVALRPEVTLGTYKGLELESELQHVTDDDVERGVEDLRKQHSRPEPAGEEGLKEDGLALGDVRFLHGEEEVFTREGLRLGIPQPPPGIDADAWKEALTGKGEGDTFTVAMTLPDSIENEEARGQEGTCEVTVKQAYDLVPPSDEEMCQGAQVEDMDGFRAKLREHMESSAQQGEQNRIETVLLERVLAEAQCDLPASILDEQTEVRLAQFEQELEQRQVPEEQREAAREEQRPTARDEAARGLKALLVVETIAEAESIAVAGEDMNAELQAIADRNQAELEEVRKYYGENQGMFQQMAVELLERKVRAFLREQATVKDPA
jgi:trigger factor